MHILSVSSKLFVFICTHMHIYIYAYMHLYMYMKNIYAYTVDPIYPSQRLCKLPINAHISKMRKLRLRDLSGWGINE